MERCFAEPLLFQKADRLFLLLPGGQKCDIMEVSVASRQPEDHLSSCLFKLPTRFTRIVGNRQNTHMHHALPRFPYFKRKIITAPWSQSQPVTVDAIHSFGILMKPLIQVKHRLNLLFRVLLLFQNCLCSGPVHFSPRFKERFSAGVIFLDDFQCLFCPADLSFQTRYFFLVFIANHGILPELVLQLFRLVRQFHRAKIHEPGHQFFFPGIKANHCNFLHFNN